MDERVMRRYFKEQFAPTYEGVVEALLPAAWTAEMERERGTLRPTVVIGIGGSGVKSVARLKRRLLTFYRGEAFEAHRRTIKWVTMDTLAYGKIKQEDPDGLVTQMIPQDEYIYLGGFNPAAYIESNGANSDLRKWWDERYRPSYAVIEDGAERNRQLGRLALYRNKDAVRAAIGRAITDSLSLHSDLVNRGLVRAIGDEEGKKVNIYIFSGTCGGTGSGMLFDVAYMAYSQILPPSVADLRLVLFMPGPFVQVARRSRTGEWKTRALLANAYAFFKELQHFAANGPAIVDWRLDASTRRGMDLQPPRGQALLTERIYLVDSEIAGREITSLPDLYALGADYVFSLMATPLGQELESDAANIKSLLAGLVGRRPAAFSSVGSSYLIYPSKTLARRASSGLLRQSLDAILRSPLTREETESAARLADEICRQGQRWFVPTAVDEALFQPAQAFVNNAPSAKTIMQRVEGQQTKISTAMVWAEQMEEEQERLGEDRVDAAFAQFKPTALDEARTLLRGLVSRVGELGVESVREALLRIKATTERRRHENWPESPSRVEREAHELIARTKSLEARWWLFWRKKKLPEQVEQFAQLLRSEINLELRGRAAEHRETFFGDIAKLIDDEFLARLRTTRVTLEAARDLFEDERRNDRVTPDESAVTITTQYLPGPPSQELVAQILEQAEPHRARFHADLFGDDQMKAILWDLGDPDEATVTDGIRRFLRLALQRATAQVGREILSKKITDVIRQQWGSEGSQAEFRATYGMNLKALADPSWRVIGDAIPQADLPRAKYGTPPVCAIPQDSEFDTLKARYLPEDLVRGPIPSGDPRMIQVMMSEHAVPLFAIGNAMPYRTVYERWLEQWQDHRECPPHIAKDWNSPSALEDIEGVQEPGTQEQRAFTLGLFLDWLIADKQDTRLIGQFAPEVTAPRGPIYQARGRGRPFMYTRWRPNAQGKLAFLGEAEMVASPHRWEAARAVTEVIRDAVEDISDRTAGVIPYDEQLKLLDEYQAHLLSKHSLLRNLLAHDEAGRERELSSLTDSNERALHRQLLEEIEILEKVRRDLRG